MTSAAPFRSILFDRPSDRTERDDPSMFGDLNLDQVFAAVAAGRDEYDLMPFFRAPLGDVRAVGYRHEVQRDLAGQELSAAVAEFAQGMLQMRRDLAESGRLRVGYSKKRWFLEAARSYRAAVAALAGRLAPLELSSRGFTGFRDYLAGYTGSAAFTGLAADIAELTAALDEVRYCVHVKGNRVRVSRYDGEPDYGEEVRATFAKFAGDQAGDSRVGFRGWAEMDQV